MRGKARRDRQQANKQTEKDIAKIGNACPKTPNKQAATQKTTSFLIRKSRFLRRQRIILRRRIDRDIRMALADLEGVLGWSLFDHARIAVQ
jgi:hypothetical protein